MGKNRTPKEYEKDPDGGERRALNDIFSKKGRVRYAISLAEKIVSLPDEQRRYPTKVRELLERISTDLGIDKGDAQ